MAELVVVIKRKGEDINKLLNRFKRKVNNSGHILELKERREFLKPSVVKRKARLAVERQNELNVKKQKIEEGDTSIRLYSNKKRKSKTITKSKNNEQTKRR